MMLVGRCKNIITPNALIIDPISIPFEDSIYAHEPQHQSAMVDVYTQMKPDSFKWQSLSRLAVASSPDSLLVLH